MPHPRNITLGFLLAVMVAMAPMSNSLYLPSLPTLAAVLRTDIASIQLTISTFLLGLASGQLVYGPLSDRFGRKPVLVGGISLYLVASIACAAAQNVETLIWARFFQAAGATCGPVIARAMVRDLFGLAKGATFLAYLGTVMGLAPVMAPVIGGYVLLLFGWRANFVLLAAVGASLILAALLILRETNTRLRPDALHPLAMARDYGTLFHHRRYLGFVFTNTLVFSGLFAFVSGAPFVLIDVLGLSPQNFGIAMGLTMIGYMGGTLTAARLSARLGVETLIVAGSLTALVAGLAMTVLTWGGMDSVAWVVFLFFIYMYGAGLVFPNSQAGAVGPFPHMAGIASSMFGFIQMSGAAIAGFVVGQLADGTARPMATTIFAVGTLAFCAYFFLIRERRAAAALPDEVALGETALNGAARQSETRAARPGRGSRYPD